jgi:hypothetical protein
MDLFKEAETKLYKRNPLFGDFPGSVAKICLEYKPECFSREGVRIPKRDGIMFRENINGTLGNILPIKDVVNMPSTSHLVITYNDEFLTKLKGTDPFLLYEQGDFPKATFNNHAPTNCRSIPDLLPNRLRPIYNLQYPARSPSSMEYYLHGPLPDNSPRAPGIPEINRCRLDIFIHDYNLPRLKAMGSNLENVRIRNAAHAWTRINEALEDPQLSRDHDRCGTPAQLRADIKVAIKSYQQHIIDNLTSYLTFVIHFKLTAHCLHEDFWVPELLGGPNPTPKPPVLDHHHPAVNRAFLVSLNKDFEKQMQRYDDIQVATIYAKFTTLFSNLHISLESAIFFYNEYIALLSMPFHQVITRYYPQSVHHIAPQLSRFCPYYFAMSAPTGFLAWIAPHTARENALRFYSPRRANGSQSSEQTQPHRPKDTNILDLFFRARKDLTPIKSHPLDSLGIPLLPSERVKQEVAASQAKKHANFEHNAHVHLEQHAIHDATHRALPTPMLSTNTTTSSPLPQPSDDTGDAFLEYFLARDRRLARSQGSNNSGTVTGQSSRVSFPEQDNPFTTPSVSASSASPLRT